jgi:putative acetyltransferase
MSDREDHAAVTVRAATDDDAEAVMAAHVAAIERFGPDAYDDEQVAAWAERPGGAEPYRENARADGEVFVVAERVDEVVGFGHLRPPEVREAGAEGGDDGTDTEGEVIAVYVHGDNARSGVGSRLLSHLETAARERGLDALVLTASSNAVGFYERHGYERGRETVHETTGGVELEVVEMRKRLRDGPDSE